MQRCMQYVAKMLYINAPSTQLRGLADADGRSSHVSISRGLLAFLSFYPVGMNHGEQDLRSMISFFSNGAVGSEQVEA